MRPFRRILSFMRASFLRLRSSI